MVCMVHSLSDQLTDARAPPADTDRLQERLRSATNKDQGRSEQKKFIINSQEQSWAELQEEPVARHSERGIGKDQSKCELEGVFPSR